MTLHQSGNTGKQNLLWAEAFYYKNIGPENDFVRSSQVDLGPNNFIKEKHECGRKPTISIFIPGKYSRFRFFENHIVENGWFELKLGRGDLHVFSFVTQLGGTDTSHYFSFFRRISVEVKG